MKIIINNNNGGFGVKREVLVKLGLNRLDWCGTAIRTSPELIKMIEEGEPVSDGHSKLKVVDIPEEATDFLVDNYDGLECIIYVENGKLRFLY